VRWEDVDSTTPVLAAVLGGGAVAVSAVRSLGPATCPVDGWLAVSAGRRAADAPLDGGGCRVPQPPGAAPGVAAPRSGDGEGLPAAAPARGAPVPRWAEYRAQAAENPFGASPGLLGDLLAREGLRSAAVGAGAAVALADSSGRVPLAWPGAPAAPGGGVDPGSGEGTLGEQVEAALQTDPALLVVDVGAVREVPPRAGGGTAGTAAEPGDEDGDQDGDQDGTSLQVQLSAVDSRIGTVLGALPETATVVVASLADAGPQPQLQLVAAVGPTGSGDAFDGGYLRSPSTRQTGMVQSPDVLPTLLHALGVAVPVQAAGAPMRPVESGGGDLTRLQRLLDLSGAAQTIDPLVTPFFAVLVALQLLLYGGTAAVLSRVRPGPGRRGLLRGVRHVAVVLALVPAATFLANLWPWWRSEHPGAVLVVAVATFTLPLAAAALLGPWRRALLGPAGVAGALTALVLTLDVATGSALSLTTLMGGQPLVAGRFYGFSNPGFALFGTGALLAATAAADALVRRGHRRTAVAAVAAVGAVATVVDVLPSLGSDFGGPPALVPAFAVLALRVARIRLTWRPLVLVAGGTVAVLAAAALADRLRPAQDRTHLGRFAQSVLDGEALGIVQRKAEQNLGILTGSPLNLLIPVAAVVVVAVLARPLRWRVRPVQVAYDSSPVLRDGVVALGVLLALGFAVNDTGTSIPPVAATLALPLLVAVCLRALEQAEAPAVDPRARPARSPAGPSGRR
jgi:hypothetical protein